MAIRVCANLIDNKPFCVIVLGTAFVALVLPFDSFRGLREQIRGLFFRAGGSHSNRETGAVKAREAKQFNLEVEQ